MAVITHVPFYPSDWLAGTRGLTAAETGVFITLLALMYERAGPVPEDASRLARQCGIPLTGFNRVLNALIDAGKIVRIDGGLFNERAASEIENVMSKSQIAKDKANSRWAKSEGKSKAEECSGIDPAMLANSHKPLVSSLRSDTSASASADRRKPSTTQAAPPTPLPPDLIRDWQAVRKAKRAGPLSQTAWDGIAREAAKAGVTLETAVRTCVERGWQSFRADWLSDKRETRAPPRQGGNGFVTVLRDLQGAFDDHATDHRHEQDDVFAVDFDELGQDRGHAGTGGRQPSHVFDLTAFDRR